MRKYAAFYSSATGKWSIIYQDEHDYSRDVWYVHMLELSEDGDDVKQLVRALNKEGY